MTPADKAKKIVHQLMFENDKFSKWLGIEILDIGPGFCTLQSTIKNEMLNGFQLCHGGVSYSIADSALAFASNSHGIQALSIETSISHTKPVMAGDIVTARATEKNLSVRFGVYEVILKNQKNDMVALFKGTVFRTGKEWIL